MLASLRYPMTPEPLLCLMAYRQAGSGHNQPSAGEIRRDVAARMMKGGAE